MFDEFCSPGLPCEIDEMACELGGDFDGDGALDRVLFVRASGDRLDIGVEWGHGGVERVVEGGALHVDGNKFVVKDFSFVIGWEVLPLRDGFYRPPEWGPVWVEASDALGDGLLMETNGDSVVLRFTADGWLLVDPSDDF